MIRALAIAFLIACAAAMAQSLRLHRTQLALAEGRAAVANAQASAERAARTTSASIVDALFDAGTSYQRGLTDAQMDADRDAAALRIGALRLRREWAGCETRRLADSSATERRLDEAARSREALAVEIVRVGAECDAKERTLISAYNGVRDRINRGPQE